MGLISHRKSARNRMIVAAAVLVLFLMPAFTPDARAADARWYVNLNVPVMFIDDSETVTTGDNFILGPTGAPIPVKYRADAVTEYETGFRVSGALGYEFGAGFRVEGEVFWARANVSKLTYTGITSGSLPPGAPPIPVTSDPTVSGPVDQLGAMVNVWYDFNTGSSWKPYIGVGLGFMRVDWGGVKYDTNVPLEAGVKHGAQLQGVPPDLIPPLPSGTVPEVSDIDTVFAYQVGAGLGYEVTDALTVLVGYRLLKSSELEFSGKTAQGATAVATTDLQVHLFELGLRYRF